MWDDESDWEGKTRLDVIDVPVVYSGVEYVFSCDGSDCDESAALM